MGRGHAVLPLQHLLGPHRPGDPPEVEPGGEGGADVSVSETPRVKDLRDATVDALRRVNREQGDLIDALRDEVRRLRDDLARLEHSSQDRPGGGR